MSSKCAIMTTFSSGTVAVDYFNISAHISHFVKTKSNVLLVCFLCTPLENAQIRWTIPIFTGQSPYSLDNPHIYWTIPIFSEIYQQCFTRYRCQNQKFRINTTGLHPAWLHLVTVNHTAPRQTCVHMSGPAGLQSMVEVSYGIFSILTPNP